ncbi:MAG: radical SAM protein [Proteobacteria bacterium]|nr:radical SAM protein [Pseudomonadota bacterium]
MKKIYTKTKIFHFPDKLAALPRNSGRIEAPVHVRIKPTNICNHRCKYCAYSDSTLDKFGKDFGRNNLSIPHEKMVEIVDDIIAMDVKAVTFSGGGEPFVYSHFLETIRKLAESPVKFASLTNGSRLKGELAEIFAHHGTWLRVSIDGWDDESYSSYRNVRIGSFSNVMGNMERFKKLGGGCYLGVSLIVDKENASHIHEFLCRMKTIGVDSVKISPCLVSDDHGATNIYHRPFFMRVREQLEKSISELNDDTFEILDAYNELNDKYEKDYKWCPYVQLLPVIGADLNVYSCPDKAYNLGKGVVGSIKNQRFKDFWFLEKDKFFEINPSADCRHHCEKNVMNRLVLEYLYSNRDHGMFV